MKELIGALLIFSLSLGYGQEQNGSILKGRIVEKDSSNKEVHLERIGHHIPEIIVTADKKEAVAQETMLSLNVLDSRQIDEFKVWDIADLGALVPNLYAANPGDLRNVVSIRGISTTSYDPAVATYIDGVNQFSLDSYISQLNDVERIEVLRGPQGTLYGRNASGGVINIITKQPDNQMRGYIQMDYGSYNLQRYTAGIKLPLVADKLYFGAANMFSSRDGFFFNEFTSSSYDDVKLSQGNYFLKYQPSERWSLLLNVKHQLQLNDGAFPLVMGVDEAFQNPFKLSQNNNTTMRDRTLNFSLSAQYRHDSFVMNTQTSYQENYRFYKESIDGDFSDFDIISVVNNYGKDWNRNKVWMHETRFSSPARADSRTRWNTGIYGFVQDSPVKQGTHYGKDADMYGSPISNFTDVGINKLNSAGLAGFGQVDYQLLPSLTLTAGLRYDYEHKKLRIEGHFVPDEGEAMVTRTDTSASAHYSNFSPKLALGYRFSNAHRVYAMYNRGFRAGGISPLSSDPSEKALSPYESEHSDNFEIGSKNMFMDRKLKLNVTVFYTQMKNGQIPVLVMPEALTLMRNSGRLTSKGAELELSAIPFKGLELDGSFGYTDAEYKDLTIVENGENKDYSGNSPVFTPRTTGSLLARYTHYLSSGTDSRLVGGISYKNIGTQYFDMANNIRQDTYDLWNARIAYHYRHIELAVWGENLANQRYIDYAYDFGAVHLGGPRRYGLTAKVTF
ncbi:TonB-dependent receptor [Sphingobacterium sp. SGG-5]|uniref:TonB-dependent receptor n=1 Tax=Sphingobacterium sp. SGG-5 TaxID=2710881 RepID=UPI0013EA009C|nr:TonB-dependent receptor [Sphingobacterium sp. SGG-5]NGM62251.1 TonB-dependent receptor [Sphingobacterium sp. SGG-5]